MLPRIPGDDGRDSFALPRRPASQRYGNATAAIVLGYTGIPLAINHIRTDITLFDIIIERAVDFSLGKR